MKRKLFGILASYKDTASMGFIGAIILFLAVVSSGAATFEKLEALLPIFLAGPIVGCLITLCFRSLIARHQSRRCRSQDSLRPRSHRFRLRSSNTYVADLLARSPTEPS